MAHLIANLQQQCHHMLRHRRRAVGRDVGHRYSLFGGRVHIHHIVARGQHADIAKLWRPLDNLSANQRFVGADDLRIADAPQNLFHIFPRRAVIDRKLTQLLKTFPGQISRILCVTIQNYYFHIHFSSSSSKSISVLFFTFVSCFSFILALIGFFLHPNLTICHTAFSLLFCAHNLFAFLSPLQNVML